MSRPQSKYVRVDPQNPEAAGQCDLCGRWYQLRTLHRQAEWAGNRIYEFNSLRCDDCWDVPNEQFRSIVLQPDPPPVLNARVPNFAYEEQTVRITQRGGAPYTAFAAPKSQPPWNAGPQVIRSLQGGMVPRILQLNTSS